MGMHVSHSAGHAALHPPIRRRQQRMSMNMSVKHLTEHLSEGAMISHNTVVPNIYKESTNSYEVSREAEAMQKSLNHNHS